MWLFSIRGSQEELKVIKQVIKREKRGIMLILNKIEVGLWK
jgi:hypothetical protein